MWKGTWLEKLPPDVWDDIVLQLPIETLLLWDDLETDMLRLAAGERWISTLQWNYETGNGTQHCTANDLIETFDVVDLPYDWVFTYRFFHPTKTTIETEELRRSLFNVFPRLGPLLHVHKSWISMN